MGYVGGYCVALYSNNKKRISLSLFSCYLPGLPPWKGDMSFIQYNTIHTSLGLRDQ